MLAIEYLEIIHLITIYYLLSEYDNNHDAFQSTEILTRHGLQKKRGAKAPLIFLNLTRRLSARFKRLVPVI